MLNYCFPMGRKSKRAQQVAAMTQKRVAAGRQSAGRVNEAEWRFSDAMEPATLPGFFNADALQVSSEGEDDELFSSCSGDSSDDEHELYVQALRGDGDLHAASEDDSEPASDAPPRGMRSLVPDYASDTDDEQVGELAQPVEEEIGVALERARRICLGDYTAALTKIARSAAPVSHVETAAAPLRPAVYSGDSSATQHRAKKKKEKHENDFRDHTKIDTFFLRRVLAGDPETSDSDADGPDVDSAVPRKVWKPSNEGLDCEIKKLKAMGIEVLLGQNVKKAKAASKRHRGDMTEYDKLRYLAVLRYFQLLREGSSQMDASLTVSKIIFNAGPYRAAVVRDWAKLFRIAGELDRHQQGRHPKRTTLIEDEVVKKACGDYLRSLKPDARTAQEFCRWFSEEYYVQRFGARRDKPLAESTARVWFKKMGWRMWEKKKGLYYDGHERPDVQRSRQAFLAAIAPFQSRMETYSGPNMEIVTPPVDITQARIVPIVQDESAVPTNEGRKRVLVEDGKEPIFPKGEGASKMISGFVCPCHGPMFLTPELIAANPTVARNTGEYAAVDMYEHNAFSDGHSFITLDIGKAKDEYFVNDDLDDQLVFRAIPIFELLHPGCEGLWLFDNSQNHRAMKEDALLVAHLNKSDGGINAPTLRNTSFTHAIFGDVVEQLMQWPDGPKKGIQKGLQQILSERGLWPAGGMSVKQARTLLAEQPDFKEGKGKGRLVERIEGWGGQHILMLPKYHCEFSFIENLWGRMKVYLRRNCAYNFAALQQSIPAAVASVPLAVLRRYARRCDRTMDAYRPLISGIVMTPVQVAFAVKKYKSHRCIARNMDSLFPEQFPQAAVAAGQP